MLNFFIGFCIGYTLADLAFCIAIIVEIGAIITVTAITVGLINKFEYWRNRKKKIKSKKFIKKIFKERT